MPVQIGLLASDLRDSSYLLAAVSRRSERVDEMIVNATQDGVEEGK